MTPFSQARPPWLRGIVRDVFVLVLAELLALALAWCLSARGRSILARLFRTGRPANSNPVTTAPIIDV